MICNSESPSPPSFHRANRKAVASHKRVARSPFRPGFRSILCGALHQGVALNSLNTQWMAIMLMLAIWNRPEPSAYSRGSRCPLVQSGPSPVWNLSSLYWCSRAGYKIYIDLHNYNDLSFWIPLSDKVICIVTLKHSLNTISIIIYVSEVYIYIKINKNHCHKW